MLVLLKRIAFRNNYTIGKLFVDGRYYCDTLEPSRMASIYPCIPVGSYPLLLAWSPKFHCYMLRLDSVPKRSGILIHAGNKPADTHGCILVGRNLSVATLSDSRSTLDIVRKVIIDHMLNSKNTSDYITLKIVENE